MPEFLTRAEGADYLTERGLKISKGTLQKIATTKGGPPYQLFGGRAYYTRPNLDAWAEAKLSPLRTSTSVLVKDDAKFAAQAEHREAAEEQARRREDGDDEDVDTPEAA